MLLCNLQLRAILQWAESIFDHSLSSFFETSELVEFMVLSVVQAKTVLLPKRSSFS